MLIKSWLTSLKSQFVSTPHCARKRRLSYSRSQNKPIPAETETLEDRTLLAAFVVDTLVDIVADDDFVSLREAIQAANTDTSVGDAGAGDPDGDTITFDASIAGGTIMLNMNLGQLEITDDLEIDGADPGMSEDNITISGGNNIRIFSVNTSDFDGSARDVSFANLTLTSGNTDNSSGNDGGAIFVTNGETVTLDSVSILNSTADGNGGAIYNGDGTLNVDNSVISGNRAVSGGGIYNDGGEINLDLTSVDNNQATGNGATFGGGGIYNDGGDVLVENSSVVEANSATGASGSGGGILVNGGTLTVIESSINGNSANRAGGGIETNDAVSAVTVQITDSSVEDNTASSAPGNGGGLHVTSPSTSANSTTVTVTGGNFSGNTAASEGGGIWNDVGGELTLNGVSIEDNTAQGNQADNGGGGVFNNGGTVMIQNNMTTATTISGNVADGTAGSGGGILNDGGTLTISGATINGNAAMRAGGGIEVTTANMRDSVANLTDVILSGNTAGSAPGNGGAVHISDAADGNSSTFNITGGTVSGNSAAAEGGGLWNAEGGTLNIDGTEISGNTASGDSADQGGGGLFNDGGIVNIRSDSSTARIENNIADGTNGSGGGILNDGGTLTIIGAVINSNSAVRAGGGIEATTVNLRDSIVTTTGVSIQSNEVGNGPGNGGGVHVTDPAGDNTSSFTITQGIVSGNSAAAEGGGLWNEVGGTLNINGSTISGNTAGGNSADQGGGGIFNNGGTVNIQNHLTDATMISGNLANGSAGSGGGILNDGGTITMTGGTISGNTANRAGGGIEVTTANGRDSDVTLNRVSILDNSTGSTPGNGGGVHISDALGDETSTFTLNRGTVSGNSAAAEGGGLWNDAGGTLNINGTAITDNTASGNSADQGGGGIFNNGGTVNIQNNVTTTTLSDNIADGSAGSGGGILNDGGTLNITGAIIDGNSAVRAGGGIEVTTANGRDSNAVLTDVILSNNFAGSNPGNGGGVHISDAPDDETSTFTITGGAVIGNVAAAEGGGLWNAVGGTLNIDGVLIESNTAGGDSADQGGGGIFNNGGIVNITSESATTVISGNIANGSAGSGGGILNDGGMLSIDGAEIDANAAVRAGGGIEVTTANMRDSTVEITNTTIVDNQAGSSPGNGGGVHITDLAADNISTFDITDSTVSGNFAAAEGGGLWNDAGGTMTITGVTIDGNTAGGDSADQGGGGIFNNGGTVTIQSSDSASMISNNVANGTAGSGGGILNDGGTLTITDATIDGNSAIRAGGGIEVTTVNMRDSDVTLTGVTLSNNTVGSSPGNGGGVHISDAAGDNVSTFEVIDSTVTGNSAASEGGGLWNDAGGTMTLTGATITDNTAGGNDPTNGGGGVFNNGGIVTIQSNGSASMISKNVANGTAGSGGGILNDGGTLTITGATIDGNSAVRAGGGIEVTTANGRDSDVTLTGVTLSNNTVGSSPGNGGGVHISDAPGDETSLFSIMQSTVTGNSAASEGGGIWNDAGGTLTIDQTTISGNTAAGTADGDGGGGIFNTGGVLQISNSTVSENSAGNEGGGIWNSGTLDVSQVTISGNSATADGGGIFAGGSLTAEVTNSTITLNGADTDDADAGTGGGIFIGSGTSLTLESTIVAGNSEADDDGDVSGNVGAGSQFNLIGVDTNLTGITDGDDGNQIGTADTPIDPQLAALTDNGGSTQTHNLLADSPAINAGSNPKDLDFDQRGEGFIRTTGAQTDVGAVEAQISITAVGSGAGNSLVRVFNSLNGDLLAEFSPYGTGFLGEIRTAVADVNGDGTLDVITGAGPSGGPHVKVFDGSSDGFTDELLSFFAFDPGFSGGVFVAGANLNPGTDNNADIIVSAGEGGGPHVRAFSGADLTEMQSFFPYNSGFSGGVRVAVGDITGDEIPDIITAAGPGGGPHVRVFDGSVAQFTVTPADIGGPLGSFFAYDAGFGGGVFVASGDINDDGRDDIITGAGAGGGPHVKVFSGMDASLLQNFFAYDPGFLGGVTVGSTQGGDDNPGDDIITGAGPGGGPHLKIFSGQTGDLVTSLLAFDSNFAGGIFVSGGTPAPQFPIAPLQFGGGAIAGVPTELTQTQLDSFVSVARTRWEEAGLPAAATEDLVGVDVRVSNLPDGLLGGSLGGTILIDSTASGAGWFLDPTPMEDEEFDANGNAVDSAAIGRIDLLTVLLHEMGHELGAEDLDILDHPESLMAESLTTGKRRLPEHDLDALFADPNQWNSLLS